MNFFHLQETKPFEYKKSHKFSLGLEDIDPNRCTHILFSFGLISADSEVKMSIDFESSYIRESNIRYENYDGKDIFEKFIQLRKANSNLKILFSIGG